MKEKVLATISALAAATLLIVGIQASAAAQGRGHGGGPPGGVGRGGGPPSGVGVDRGLGTASERSAGRVDEGLGNASDRSSGRSDDGLTRARTARNNSQQADQELHDHPQLAEHLGINVKVLRTQYQTALATNPNLKFGQFIAANILARNLGHSNPNVTTSAILNGLADGQSIGQTLQDLGLSSSAAKAAQKQAKQQLKKNS
jgi:hypothetical protein